LEIQDTPTIEARSFDSGEYACGQEAVAGTGDILRHLLANAAQFRGFGPHQSKIQNLKSKIL